jgi:hypothetical protein
LERSKTRLIEAVRAFVPPADPAAEDVTVNLQSKIATKQIPLETTQTPKETLNRAETKTGPRMRQKASVDERPKSSQSRPGSANLGPKRKIGATTSEPHLLTPRNVSESKISIGFDCRSQRVAKTVQDNKSVADLQLKEIAKEIEAMQNDEKRVDIMTPQHRRGLHSSEEAKRVKQDEDEESIQWKEIIPLQETKLNERLAGERDGPLSTLDTAMDWQQVQNLTHHDGDDDEEDEEESWHSPRFEFDSWNDPHLP